MWLTIVVKTKTEWQMDWVNCRHVERNHSVVSVPVREFIALLTGEKHPFVFLEASDKPYFYDTA